MSIPRGNGGLKAERPTTHPKPLPHPEFKIPGIKVKLEKLPKWLPHPEFKIPVNSRNYGPAGTERKKVDERKGTKERKRRKERERKKVKGRKRKKERLKERKGKKGRK